MGDWRDRRRECSIRDCSPSWVTFPASTAGLTCHAILRSAELEKARVDAANIKVGAPVLRSSNMEPKQLHVA